MAHRHDPNASLLPRVLRGFERAPTEPSRVVLAADAHGRVELCACGTAHLSLGAVTFKVPLQAIVQLHALLGDALQRLDRADRAPASPDDN